MIRIPSRLVCRLLFLIAASLGVPALAQHAPEAERDAGGYKAPTEALERGRAVYVLNHCHFCHGLDLTRANMGAANLAQSPLVGADVDGNAIGPLIRAGLPNLQTAMPSYRNLSDQEIVDLARYLHYLRQQARFNALMKPHDLAGNAERGRAYFAGAGNCASCHTGANGLDSVADDYDAETLRQRLLRPGPPKPKEGVEPTAGQAAHWKLLENYTPENVEDLLAYLQDGA